MALAYRLRSSGNVPEKFTVADSGRVVAEVGIRESDRTWPDHVRAAYIDKLAERTASALEQVCAEAARRGLRRVRVQCASRDTSLRGFYAQAEFRFKGIIDGAALFEKLIDTAMSLRAPFPATAYENAGALPVSVLLDNIRSQYNVGAFFRTADAAGVCRLYLCGITAQPPAKTIAKTALGAEDRVPWQHYWNPLDALESASASAEQVAAIETSAGAIDLYDWEPQFPVCVIFGNEVEGISPELLDRIPLRIRIPMLGVKHSLNVATAGGVVIYELLRKHRRLVENSR